MNTLPTPAASAGGASTGVSTALKQEARHHVEAVTPQVLANEAKEHGENGLKDQELTVNQTKKHPHNCGWQCSRNAHVLTVACCFCALVAGGTGDCGVATGAGGC